MQMQGTHLQVVLFYGTSALLVSRIVRNGLGRVVDGYVINGAWQLKNHIEDSQYDEEVEIPENIKGCYDDVIAWALNHRVERLTSKCPGCLTECKRDAELPRIFYCGCCECYFDETLANVSRSQTLLDGGQ